MVDGWWMDGRGSMDGNSGALTNGFPGNGKW